MQGQAVCRTRGTLSAEAKKRTSMSAASPLHVFRTMARRAYRRLPQSAKAALHARIPPLTRYRLAQWLVRQSGRPQVGGPNSATVTIGGRRQRAVVDSAATPLSVRRFNLDFVISVLDRAGIDYFSVPHDPGIRSRIGIHGDDLQAAVDALAGAAPEHGVVITPAKGRRRSPCYWVYRPTATSEGWLTYGPGYGCEIESWAEEDGVLLAPQPNAVSSRLPVKSERVLVPPSDISTFVPADDTRMYATRRQFAVPRATTVRFPIDVVYTWVDGSDQQWRQRWLDARCDHDVLSEQAANDARYLDREELRFSLRSLHLNAPWVRHIYLVTDDQLPYWLDPSHPRITVVSHRELFEPGSRLPTFNSHAIESQIHRIPGLSEHFIYFNDDVFVGRPITPATFFHSNGIAKFFVSRSAQLDIDEASFEDFPVDAAGKNNREVIRERFGSVITQKMKHTPHPLRRSVLETISRDLRDQVMRTRDNQFRHPTDLSIASSLHHYWSYLEGTSVPGSLRYLYTDLADPETPTRLFRLLRRRDFHTFCLNDTDSDPESRAEMTALVNLFLNQYFPVRSPFELDSEVEAGRRGVGATALAHSWQQIDVAVPAVVQRAPLLDEQLSSGGLPLS